MKVLIIFMPQLYSKVVFEKTEVPPLSIYLLAAMANASGFQADIIDPCEFSKFEYDENIIDECGKYIINQAENVDVFAFSSNTFNWPVTRLMINYVRKVFPGIPIVVGGLHPSKFDEHVLRTTGATYVLRGDGEISFPHLLKVLSTGYDIEKVSGLSYIDNGKLIRNEEICYVDKEILEQTPYPDFSLLPRENTYTQIPVETSRGCPFCCAFCSIPHRRKWFYIDEEFVVNRVHSAIETSNNILYKDYILFVDDCFTINTNRAIQIFNRLNEKYDGNIKIFFEIRISNLLEKDIFSFIRTDMIYGMQFGVECGYDYGLERINKKLTIEQLYKGLDIIESHNLNEKTVLSFIIGFPWERREDIQRTLNTIEFIVRNYGILCNLNWLLMLPSVLWDEREKYGICVDESIFDEPLCLIDKEKFFILHPQITEEDVRWVNEWFYNIREEGLEVAFYNVPYLDE